MDRVILMEQFNHTWDKVIDMIKEEIPVISLETWIKPLILLDVTETKLIFKATTDYHKTLVETRYLDLIRTATKYVTSKDYDISIILDDETKDENSKIISNMYGYSTTCLNPKYTFENFVINSAPP